MAKKTTVELTEFVESIKDCLVSLFGLKNILSAGIIILDKLTDEDLNKAIFEANGKSVRLDLYEDRKKLVKIREIIESHPTQTGGADIPPADCRKLLDLIGNIQPPTESSWHLPSRSVNPKVEVLVTPSRLDDFRKCVGPDDAAVHSESHDKNIPKGHSSRA